MSEWTGRTPTADEWRAILERHAAWLSGTGGKRADLRGAYLRGAYLRGADLRGAYLRGADLARLQIVQDHGSFRAWKKLRGGVIAELEIPDGAGRVGGVVGRKCRAERALCIALSEGTEAASLHNGEFVYRTGEMATPDVWNPDPRDECAGGIHFFLTRIEAEEYEA